jgi:tRNA (cmo5U34)-methyltransferase
MDSSAKASVDDIRARFDRDVERFSQVETGQTATIDAALCLDLVSTAAAAVTSPIRRVLDVGCGAGNYSLKLRERAPEATFTLVDLSRPMLDRARERLGAAVADTRQEDVRNVDFASGSFDVIMAAAVLHHLRAPSEWEQVFAGFFRWLRPGGSLWVFDLVAHENAAVQQSLWQRYGDYLTAQGGPDYREKVFSYIAREDTPTPLTYQLQLARAAGFSPVDVLHKNACFAAYGAVK